MIHEKLEHLQQIIERMGSALVAFSGGVDSAFLLKVARQVLGDRVLAVTAVSPTYSRREIEEAQRLAAEMGVRHQCLLSDEWGDGQFRRNDQRRCYYCRRRLFAKLKELAASEGLRYILDGSNQEDLDDDRPGLEAARELNVRSPLQEAELTKAEIRQLSKEMGLETWSKPTMACLASRIPYGTPLRIDDLRMVERAEGIFKKLGVPQVRVRHHGHLARVEVSPADMDQVMAQRDLIVSALKAIGYIYVTLDLEGYRAGSMNEVLAKR